MAHLLTTRNCSHGSGGGHLRPIVSGMPQALQVAPGIPSSTASFALPRLWGRVLALFSFRSWHIFGRDPGTWTFAFLAEEFTELSREGNELRILPQFVSNPFQLLDSPRLLEICDVIRGWPVLGMRLAPRVQQAPSHQEETLVTPQCTAIAHLTRRPAAKRTCDC